MSLGRVVALHRKPRHGALEEVEALEGVAGEGFVGDRCAGSQRRQVLLVSTESLEQLGLSPGQLREQVTVDLAGLQAMPPGTCLAIGSAVVELTEDCAPCGKMAGYLGESEEDFIRRSTGKRGMLGRVLRSGHIRVGDEVRRVDG
jgi:MOSC domain-containing protein YiiM